MNTPKNDVAAAATTIDPRPGPAGVNEAFAPLAGLFARREARLTARAYTAGLLSDLERKNGWSLAEFAGDATPDAVQRLLNTAVWDKRAATDSLRGLSWSTWVTPAGPSSSMRPGS